MDLMEYQAQQLFMAGGVPVKKGVVAADAENLVMLAEAEEMTYPLVVKAQVQVGGRGKAGGIKFAANVGELKAHAEAILGMDIKGHVVKQVMAVEKADVVKEFYLSIMLDRLSKCPVIIFSAQGGMEIEEVARTNPEAIIKTIIEPSMGISGYTGQYLADKAGLSSESAKQFKKLLLNLYQAFQDNYCTLVEINPLIVDSEGNICAVDGKVAIDDSAVRIDTSLQAYKTDLPDHPLVEEAKKHNFFCVPCEDDGTIAVVCNGSGMLMNTIDRVSNRGFKARLALDLGGGATRDRVKEAIRIVCTDDKVETLLINVFGGITRCDEVAAGIETALQEGAITKTIILRLEGSNKAEGTEIIKKIKQIIHVEDLNEGLDLLVARTEAMV